MSTPHHIIPPQNGSTALLASSFYGHSEVVKLLLQSGAKDLPDKVLQQEHNSNDKSRHFPTFILILLSLQFGYTALSVARAKGHTNIVSVLEHHLQ